MYYWLFATFLGLYFCKSRLSGKCVLFHTKQNQSNSQSKTVQFRNHQVFYNKNVNSGAGGRGFWFSWLRATVKREKPWPKINVYVLLQTLKKENGKDKTCFHMLKSSRLLILKFGFYKSKQLTENATAVFHWPPHLAELLWYCTSTSSL